MKGKAPGNNSLPASAQWEEWPYWKWTCPSGSLYYTQYNKCLTPVEVDKLSTQPKACLPYKNPIYPMTGTKREVVETGFVLGDQELQLVYDTAGRPSTKLWNSSFHKNLKLTTNSTTGPVVVNRGGGRTVGFERATGTGTDICGARAGIEDLIGKVGSDFHYKDEQTRYLETYDAGGRLNSSTALQDRALQRATAMQRPRFPSLRRQGIYSK
jgi:hypothetical protein